MTRATCAFGLKLLTGFFRTGLFTTGFGLAAGAFSGDFAGVGFTGYCYGFGGSGFVTFGSTLGSSFGFSSIVVFLTGVDLLSV